MKKRYCMIIHCVRWKKEKGCTGVFRMLRGMLGKNKMEDI